jgi:hypothetical protein
MTPGRTHSAARRWCTWRSSPEPPRCQHLTRRPAAGTGRGVIAETPCWITNTLGRILSRPTRRLTVPEKVKIYRDLAPAHRIVASRSLIFTTLAETP